MEWSILFMGPVGAGKTEAIRSLSDIQVLDTDVAATDETALLKDKTTVSMDVGVLNLGDGDKLRLYGAPGQNRFDFMWEILVERTRGIIIMLNHANENPLGDLDYYLESVRRFLTGRSVPVVIGVTHTDQRRDRPFGMYLTHLARNPVPFAAGVPPVIPVDARQKRDARILMMAMTGMLEVAERFSEKAA